jgi:hypothetical protein
LGIGRPHPHFIGRELYPNNVEIGRDQRRSPSDGRRVVNRRHPDNKSVRPLDYASPELSRNLKLPDPDKPSQFLWPPPQPLVPPELLAAIRPAPFIISEAAKGTYIDARNRRILEDNRRQIAEAEQRQREFDERQRKELESAKERDRHAYRERGWPSG